MTVAYYVIGDYDHAIEAANRLGPDNPDRYVLLASSLFRLSRMDEARAAVKKLLELDPRFTQARVRDNYSYADPAIYERQVADLGAAGLPEN